MEGNYGVMAQLQPLIIQGEKPVEENIEENSSFKDISFSAMEIEQNNNLIGEKKGRKREAGKVFEDKSKSRAKNKRVVKKISRDEEEEDEMKPLEEKVIHRQKAWLSVKDGGEWEERGQGYVKVIKHL